jgi:hypothetical protein
LVKWVEGALKAHSKARADNLQLNQMEITRVTSLTPNYFP